MSARPPSLARWLLGRRLPWGPRREAILGDLEEEYRARLESRGVVRRLRARAWYWREALAVAARYTLEPDPALAMRRDPRRMEQLMDALTHNLLYAVRRLVRAPFFTVVAVLSLGLGIGANTAIFSLVNAVMIRDLPLEDPESLVDLFVESPGFSHGTFSFPDLQDLERGTRDVFSQVAAFQLALLQTAGDDGSGELMPGEGVTGDYFSLLSEPPVAGRYLGPEDHVAPGAHPVVVLGYGFWQRRFGGDPSAVGQDIRLGDRDYQIVGVAPEGYTGALRGIVPDVYLPIYMLAEVQGFAPDYDNRGNQSIFAKGRLRPGVGMAEVEASLERVTADLRRDEPDYWSGDRRVVLIPTRDVIMNPMVDRVLVPATGMLMAVVGLVLLIACANLASFLLARAADRRKEIAVRLALGARRRTLIGQLLTETLLLSALGGALGVALAVISLRALAGADLPLPLPITFDLSLDAPVLGYSLLVTLVAGVLFGLAPAIQGTNPDVAPTLRDETAGGGRARGAELRNLLVMTQVAVSMVLLVGAGLFLRSLQASRGLDPGFGDAPTAMLQLNAPASRYTEEEAWTYLQTLTSRVEALPEVTSATTTDNVHLNALNTSMIRVQVDGIRPQGERDFDLVDHAGVGPDFFSTLGLPILAGRGIGAEDRSDAEAVVVVNEAFVGRFFPDGEAVGRSIRVNGEEARVVGVSADAKIRQLGEEPRPFVYGASAQRPRRLAFLMATTPGDAEALTRTLMAQARALDPQIIIFEAKTLERHFAALSLGREMGAQVLGGFAVLALLLAGLGLYGVVSYAVARRTREVGIRTALGAESGAVVWMLTRSGLRLVVLGGAVGLLVAALLSRFLSRLLYGIPPLDPLTFVGVPLILLGVALLASWIPAMRAARVDPVTALRSD
ncbi:MAG: ADOP family duplicated permease [Gemmatimonadota bacterium]